MAPSSHWSRASWGSGRNPLHPARTRRRGNAFKWLQSVDNPDLAFVVIDPCEVMADYRFEIDDETVRELESSNAEDYIPMVIVNIPREDPIKMTANLRAPVVVNALNRRGRQIVLKDDLHAFDHRVFPMPVESAQAIAVPTAATA